MTTELTAHNASGKPDGMCVGEESFGVLLELLEGEAGLGARVLSIGASQASREGTLDARFRGAAVLVPAPLGPL